LDFPRLSVGLHFDFGEWACRDGEWKLLYEVVPLRDHQQVADEVARQLDTFCHLIGRDPTHLDSHQHIHRKEPLRSVLIDVARRLGVPLRHMDSSIRYCGDFYGQDAEGKAHPELITVGRLNKIFERLPSDWTELACHPGDVESEELDTMYRSERNKEMAVLCGPRLLDMLALRGIQLCSFADFAFARSKGQTAEVLSP
jgi:predicted glycoside hydrolase/deacetylase ChbG (UPF0249 family)